MDLVQRVFSFSWNAELLNEGRNKVFCGRPIRQPNSFRQFILSIFEIKSHGTFVVQILNKRRPIKSN